MFKKLLSLTVFCLVSRCLLMAQTTPVVIPLWEKGAPGFENRRNEPEIAKDYYVRNVHNPSLTVYLPPKDKANGMAMVVCPGGGHRMLVMTSEGVEPAKFLTNLGITVFVLKYRLGRDTLSPYKVEVHGREDGNRAMRLVRSRAAEWGIDPNRIGMMGFSAGGEIVDMVTFGGDKEHANAKDPIDRVSSKPNFIVQIYPGPLYVPDVVPADAPTAFMAVANDDPCCAVPIVSLLQKYRDAKAPIEVHIFEKGGHAFNMGYRSKLKSIHSWPDRLADWFSDNNFMLVK